ncbi:MAG: HAMP domain-containing histidine kinase [Spirochaetia bacterium]|nr:HAMP domain-containing histidine kinase [Spirochaetia bacterium]
MADKPKTSENKLVKIAETSSELPVIAAGLVHEVKNPLAAIHLHLQLLEGYSDEIKDQDVRQKIQKKVNVIKKEILGLNFTLQEFIHHIRSEESKHAHLMDINEMIQEVIQLLEPQAARESVHVEFFPGEFGRVSNADPVYIKQIVINLILNAVQSFIHAENSDRDRQIKIISGKRGDQSFITVEDNGPGIPEEIQEKIFSPFYTTKAEGSGLGLALVKKMTGEMGGTVELKSLPGSGTEITIILGDRRLESHKDDQNHQIIKVD